MVIQDPVHIYLLF